MDVTERLIHTLQPDGQAAAIWLINELRASGLPAIVVSARRSLQRQRELLRARATTATRSKHLSGKAMDIGFASLSTSAVPISWWSYAGLLWESVGGRWGGRFRDVDLVHFDF